LYTYTYIMTRSESNVFESLARVSLLRDSTRQSMLERNGFSLEYLDE